MNTLCGQNAAVLCVKACRYTHTNRCVYRWYKKPLDCFGVRRHAKSRKHTAELSVYSTLDHLRIARKRQGLKETGTWISTCSVINDDLHTYVFWRKENRVLACIHYWECTVNANIVSAVVMTVCSGSRGGAPLIHNLGTRREWAVNFMPPVALPMDTNPVPVEQGAGWAPEPIWAFRGRRESVPPARITTADHSACSLSLYRLKHRESPRWNLAADEVPTQ
jgi:hypothetical protein